MIKNECYYLSSLESVILEEPRKCCFVKKITFDTGKEAIIASIEPAIQRLVNDKWLLLDHIILTALHEGYGLSPITSFPCFVYVAFLKDVDSLLYIEEISKSETEVLGRAEIYRNELDAINHKFDT